MDTPFKVATETAKLIPFHCVICFDAFHSKDRPPMVLPCGHTFVCLPCTKRIQKCVECREPLHIKLDVNSTQPETRTPVRARFFETYITSPQSPVTPSSQSKAQTSPKTVPLPVPKNLVLIAMMDAAERQSRAREESDHPARNGKDDEEQFDLHQIINGISTLSSTCGTYVVKDPSGLTVVSSDPRRGENKERCGEDKVTGNIVALVERQKLQIVDFEDGVARLARNAGFVQANVAQLVKVGAPLDEACQLEGLLKTVQNRSADLQREMETNKEVEDNLRRQLKTALEANETTPTDTQPDEYLSETSKSISFDSHPTTPEQHIVQPVLHIPESVSGSFSSATNSFEDTPSRQSSPKYGSQHEGEIDFGYGVVQNNSHLFFYPGSEDDENTHSLRQSRSERMPSLPRMPTHTSSFDAIDFRTGLSGHRGLSISRSGGSYTPRVRMRTMMSHHRGITNNRPYRGPPTPPSRSFTDSSLK